MATNFSGRRLDRDGLAGTMEGAVRSGYLAAEAITESFGNRQKFGAGFASKRADEAALTIKGTKEDAGKGRLPDTAILLA